MTACAFWKGPMSHHSGSDQEVTLADAHHEHEILLLLYWRVSVHSLLLATRDISRERRKSAFDLAPVLGLVVDGQKPLVFLLLRNGRECGILHKCWLPHLQE